jgi:hypothetical protein
LHHIEPSGAAVQVAEAVSEWQGVDEALIRGVNEGFCPSPDGTGSASPPKETMQALPDVTSSLLSTTALGQAAVHAATVLPGPMAGIGTEFEDKYAVMKTLLWSEAEGTNHLLWNKWQKAYGTEELSSNIVMPVIMTSKDPVTGLEETPKETGGGRYFVTNLVLLAHEDDCERIARAHIKKSPQMTPLFGESVISTTNHTQWMKLRSSLGMAFLPSTSLAPIFDISVGRAKEAVRIMHKKAGNGENAVNASEVSGSFTIVPRVFP